MNVWSRGCVRGSGSQRERQNHMSRVLFQSVRKSMRRVLVLEWRSEDGFRARWAN
jgi:hypothetical protein